MSMSTSPTRWSRGGAMGKPRWKMDCWDKERDDYFIQHDVTRLERSR